MYMKFDEIIKLKLNIENFKYPQKRNIELYLMGWNATHFGQIINEIYTYDHSERVSLGGTKWEINI